MSFNRRAARELINEAVVITGEIKDYMQKTEHIYNDYMDHDGADMLGDWLISELDEILEENGAFHD